MGPAVLVIVIDRLCPLLRGRLLRRRRIGVGRGLAPLLRGWSRRRVGVRGGSPWLDRRLDCGLLDGGLLGGC